MHACYVKQKNSLLVTCKIMLITLCVYLHMQEVSSNECFSNVHLMESQGSSQNSANRNHSSMDTTTEIVTEISSTANILQQEEVDEVVIHKTTRKWVLSSDDDEDEEADTTVKANKISRNSKKKPAYSLEKLPQVVSKLPRDEKPFPDPFPLPANYRSDVAAALASKSMTVQTTQSFMTTIGAAMFSYKKKPTADDYYNVAIAITSKYPFLKSLKELGKPYVSFKYTDSFAM